MRADRRRGGDRRQQLRRRDAAGGGRAGRARARDRRLARAAGRDRRRLPRARGDRAGGRAAGRGRHHQPHAPRRLRARDRRAHRRDPARAPVELPPARLRGGGRDRGAVRARRAGDRRRRLGRARRRPRRARATSRRCARSVAAGAALVCFSGDKLLGGPQAGLLVGRADAVARARAHPLARALRLDKLGLAALEATLRLYRDPERARREIPVLAMLAADEDELRRGRARLAALIPGAEVVPATARVGGGALPLLELPGPVVAVGGGGRGRARGAAARGRPAGRRADRGRAAAARPAHARRRRARGRRSRGRARAQVPDAVRAPLTLGTAGHIDHGKTALIRALTGVDTDRLPEERERGISIELGYAPLDAAVRAAAVGGRRARPRALRAHDGRRRDRDRPVPDGRRRRRRRDAADARARGRAGGARRDARASWRSRRPTSPTRRARCAEAAELLPGAEAVAVSARTGDGARRAARRARRAPRPGCRAARAPAAPLRAARRPRVHDPRRRDGGHRHAVVGQRRAAATRVELLPVGRARARARRAGPRRARRARAGRPARRAQPRRRRARRGRARRRGRRRREDRAGTAGAAEPSYRVDAALEWIAPERGPTAARGSPSTTARARRRRGSRSSAAATRSCGSSGRSCRARATGS